MLAGVFLPALNLAVCWKPSSYLQLLRWVACSSFNLLVEEAYVASEFLRQSAGNLFDLSQLGILRDPTPEFIFCNNVVISSSSLDVRGNQGLLLLYLPFKGDVSKASLYPQDTRPKAEYGRRVVVRDKSIKSLFSTQAGVNIMPPQPNLNRLDFSSYLAGLIEGDGSIFVPKTLRSDKGKLNYPSIQICFHLKDLPLAMLIQKELGHGSLARVKGVNAYVLTINNFDGVILVTSLINGNMKTPKVHSLFKLID